MKYLLQANFVLIKKSRGVPGMMHGEMVAMSIKITDQKSSIVLPQSHCLIPNSSSGFWAVTTEHGQTRASLRTFLVHRLLC